jgi:thioredoxin 1
MANKITDETLDAILKENKYVVIDFWANWCNPCKMLSPIIDELEDDYEGRVYIGKVNVDDNDDTVERYGIRNLPTIVFIKEGEEIGRMAGAFPKQKIDDKLKELFGV